MDVGVFRTPSADPPERRLLDLSREMERWLDRHAPDSVAVERVFAQVNLRTVTGTAQVAGLAMCAAADHDIPVALHTPSEVKAAVTGYGGADKAQVQEMVMRILGLSARPHPADAADALALAICHAWHTGASTARSGVGGSAAAPTRAQEAWARAERATRRGR